MPGYDFTPLFIQRWDSADNRFPVWDKTFTRQERKEREKRFDLFEKSLNDVQLKEDFRNRQNNGSLSFFKSLRTFMNSVFDYGDDELDLIFSESFSKSTQIFLKSARHFDADLKPEDIYQACRNVWIMNSIQLMLNQQPELTPAIFAYSLIYPYSDNFLDDPSVTKTLKIKFNERFRQRLEGQAVLPENRVEKALYRLVNMIEKQYNRLDYPDVYESLYLIHDEQTRSLELFKNKTELTSEKILAISFGKGGASVLADGFLVGGELSPEFQKAFFGFGVYLQLLDDIQDIHEDCQAGVKTVFNMDQTGFQPEWTVNQTINFGRDVLADMECFEFPGKAGMIKLVRRSLETMIIESAGLNRDCFSAGYLHEIEKNSPLGFEYLRKKKAKNRSRRFEVFQKYFKNQMQEKEDEIPGWLFEN